MAVLQYPVVTKCKICGTQVVLTYHETFFPDPTGDELMKITKMILDNARCDDCRKYELYCARNGIPLQERKILHV